MSTENNHYFIFRQVNPEYYAGFTLPAYLKKVLSTLKEPRILDFGCGFGQMLNALRLAGISTAEGIDIEPDAIKYCQSKGFSCFNAQSDLNFYLERRGHYDLIIMSHVLEHFQKEMIIPQLKKIGELLKPNGYLMVMVPNAQSNTGAYWAYEDFTHQLLFTSGSLYFTLSSAGYNNIEFLDIDCTEGLMPWKKVLKKIFYKIYTLNYLFWNRVTSSAIHQPSPIIFSYEIKAIARFLSHQNT